MSAILGVSVGTQTVHAALVRRGAIRWAGHTTYHTLLDLREALACLVAECTERPRRARVVLERALVQFRTVAPVPPLRPSALPTYVALEAPRLFRNGSGPLVTDATIRVTDRGPVLWAAAAGEAFVSAVLDGCRQAGLTVETVGPASELWPAALAMAPAEGPVAIANGDGIELVDLEGAQTTRTRLVASAAGAAPPWVPALACAGPEVAHTAPAYAAAMRAPQLRFLPRDAQEARRLRAQRHVRWLAAATIGLWLLVAVAYAGRLEQAARAADRELRALEPAVDSALAVRRDLDAATSVLGTVRRAEAARSRHLALLAALAAVLPDSSVLVALRVASDSTVRLAGYAASGAQVLARLEGLPMVSGVRLEGPLTRETVGVGPGAPRSWDRFVVVARWSAAP